MSNTMVAITGNTYPVRESLKSMCDGKWNAELKAWMVPADKADKAREIVAGASKSTPSSYRPRKCVVCGVEERRNSRGYVENKIYRSGECRDCYEERKMGY